MPLSAMPQNAAKPRLLRSVLLAGDRSTHFGADAVILDSLRGAGGHRSALVFARVSADEATIDAQLDAAMPSGTGGIAVAGFTDGGAIALLGARIAAREAICGLPDGSTSILAIVSSSAALLELASLREAGPRLVAVGWDAEALAADIGAAAAWDGGVLIEPLTVARTLCLAAAASVGVPAIDTAMPAGTEAAVFLAEAERARRQGFRGKFARTDEEARILNEIFGRDRSVAGPKS